MISSSSPDSSFKISDSKPFLGPANQWNDLEKSIFRLVTSAPDQELVLDAFASNFVLFSHKKRPGAVNVFILYTPDNAESIRLLFRKTVSTESPGKKLTLVLFGGGEEAAALLACPQGPSYWAKCNIIHVADDHLPHLINGREDKFLWPQLQQCANPLVPDLADLKAFKDYCTQGVMRAIERKDQLEEFRARLSNRQPWITRALLAILVIYALLTVYLGGFENMAVSSRLGALIPDAVKGGQWWRLITTGFLHGGWLHLALNGYALYLLGGQMERIIGSWRYLLLYVVSLIGGALTATYLGGGNPSVGASGAIWGLMCAEAVIIFRPRGLMPEFFASGAKRSVISCLVINLVLSFSIPNIDIYSHIGGGLAGAVLMASGLLNWGLNRLGEKPNPNNGLANLNFAIAGAVEIALVLVAVFLGMETAKPWDLLRTPQLVKTDYAGQVVQLPKIGVGDFKLEEGALTGGDLLHDAASFAILAKDIPVAEQDSDILAAVQSELKKTDNKALTTALRKISGKDVLVVSQSGNSLVVYRYFWVENQKVWRLELYIRSAYVEKFGGMAERIISSVE